MKIYFMKQKALDLSLLFPYNYPPVYLCTNTKTESTGNQM